MRTPPATTPALYAQEDLGDRAIVHAHYFVGSCDWFITEYDPTARLAFGWVCLGDRDCAEYGYVSIVEMAGLPPRLRPDFDDDWEPVSLAEAIGAHDAHAHGLIGAHRG